MTDLLLRALYRAQQHPPANAMAGMIKNIDDKLTDVLDRSDRSVTIPNGTLVVFDKDEYDDAGVGKVSDGVNVRHGTASNRVSKKHILVTIESTKPTVQFRIPLLPKVLLPKVEVQRVFVQTWLSQNKAAVDVGVGIAGNSAKIGGGLTDGASGILKPQWDTLRGGQEESVIQSWILDEQNHNGTQPQLTMNRVVNAWRLPDGASRVEFTATGESVDFVNTTDASVYARTVTEENCNIEGVSVTLVFAAGPNCNPDTHKITMRMTRNKEAVQNKDFFKECLLNAYYGTLCAMRDAKVKIALLPFLSSKIYVGPHESWYTIDVATSLVRTALALALVQGASFEKVIILY